LLVVEAIRYAIYNAAASKKWEDYDRYQEWLTDYMTDQDRKEAAFHAEIRRKFGPPPGGRR
jgi:hypothetical protein